MDKDLEIVIERKIKPLIKETTSRFLGVNIDQLNEDISSRLDKSLIEDIPVNTALGFKEAKKEFKKNYFTKLLVLNLGNISEVAKKAGEDRRSVHRIIHGFRIKVQKIKKELLKPYPLKVAQVGSVIEHVLEDYKDVLHPEKVKSIYSNVSQLSEDILKELPETAMQWKDAEHEFERRYLQTLLKTQQDAKKLARQIGLRYETLHRKLKALGLR